MLFIREISITEMASILKEVSDENGAAISVDDATLHRISRGIIERITDAAAPKPAASPSNPRQLELFK